MRFKVVNGIPDHLEIFFQGGLENLGDVEIPALAEDGYHRCVSRYERPAVPVLLYSHATAASGAECHQLCVF